MKLGRHLDFLGHATTVIELGGLRVLTDPVLRPHLAFLERQVDAIPPDRYAGIDVVVDRLRHREIEYCRFRAGGRPLLRAVLSHPIATRPASALFRRLAFEAIEVRRGP